MYQLFNYKLNIINIFIQTIRTAVLFIVCNLAVLKFTDAKQY